MKVKEIMDKNFIGVDLNMTIVDASIKMESHKKFTTPVLDSENTLIGWITSLDVTRGLRENHKYVKDIMHSTEEIVDLHQDEPARLAVLAAAQHKLVSIPILDDEGKVVGVVRTFDIVKTLSKLYEIKVTNIFKAMSTELKGVSWEELMEASAIVTKRETGKRVTAKEYEQRIKNSTFGEAIWATGGLEKFFVGLIAIGELVIARKVAKARK
jgi:predicted transcriptional regulator